MLLDQFVHQPGGFQFDQGIQNTVPVHDPAQVSRLVGAEYVGDLVLHWSAHHSLEIVGELNPGGRLILSDLSKIVQTGGFSRSFFQSAYCRQKEGGQDCDQSQNHE